MNLEQKALQFATKAHKEQYRRDGKTPYVEHPIRVVNRLKGIGITNRDILCSGYLHDVIEDCGISSEVLETEFNPNIARIVLALTRNVDNGQYNQRIRDADYQIQIVKLADVVDNCLDLHEGLGERIIRRKVEDCKSLYLGIAKKIAPEFYEIILKFVRTYGFTQDALI